MVQEFNVVCCYSCFTYQVEQVKKSSNKWTCKICNEKQSLKLVFFTGSGKQCRPIVQQQNMKRSSQNQNEEVTLRAHETDQMISGENMNENKNSDAATSTTSSKWSKFIDNENNEEATSIQ